MPSTNRLRHLRAPQRRLSKIASAVAQGLPLFALPLAALPLASLASNAYAEDTPATASAAISQDGRLPGVSVKANRDVLPGDPAPALPGGQVASGAQIGVLGQQKLIDVPFSVTSYTAQTIADQQAHTVADVVANDPAVRSAYGYGTFAENYIIRGFEVYSDDISLNGLYGITPRQLVATETLERVDIFKGANTFVNGAAPGGSGIGGNINLETKRADDTPLTRVTVEGSASGQLGTHIDIGRRFGDNDQFGIRVNQTVESGETSVDGEHRRTEQTSVALDYRGSQWRVSGDFIYQKQHVSDGRPVVYVTGDSVPSVPSATTNYAQTWTYYDLQDTVGMLRAEYDLTPNWTVYATGGLRHTDEHSDTGALTYGTDGATTGYRFGVPLKEDAASAEVGVRGKFMTGPVSNAVNVGVLVNRIVTDAAYDGSATYATSLYNTTQVARPGDAYSAGNFASPGTTARTLLRSVSVADTFGFFQDRLLLTAGMRHQSIVANGYAYGTGEQDSAYNESATTPIFGAV
nr:TonB-dependent receptor plug domain-containing protein [Robbsia betulipollinis]